MPGSRETAVAAWRARGAHGLSRSIAAASLALGLALALGSLPAVAAEDSPEPRVAASPGPVVAASPAPTAGAATWAGPTWEYRSLILWWNEDGEWQADWADGTNTVGLSQVLNDEGAFGWEVVSVEPQRFRQAVVGEGIEQQASWLMVVLKRPDQ